VPGFPPDRRAVQRFVAARASRRQGAAA
jgi:hypothetical protein